MNLVFGKSEKSNILTKLSNLDTIRFDFTQYTNDKIENGECLLSFPGKLKCNYSDDKQKEMIINNNKMSITQKRYNKTYHYPISKSALIQILDKDKLYNKIKKSKLVIADNEIKLIEPDEKFIILFENKEFNLIGWEIKDKFNNITKFIIEIKIINEQLNDDEFKIPEIKLN
jgi:outer membrane lipoprotein-sorting protein